MDDPGPMGGVQRVGDLLRDGQSLREWQGAPAHAIVQSVALDQLEHQGRHVVGIFETVDCSDVKRATRSASVANSGGRSFNATSRPSLVSRARYTSPMPPAPSGATISYGPSFVPEVRAIRARNYSPKNAAFALEFNGLRVSLIEYFRLRWEKKQSDRLAPKGSSFPTNS